MFSFSQQTKILEHTDTKGVFEIEALYPGYGITIANSLRRVLLSSLEGTAVTQVEIKDVSHEFATLPGVYEDIIQILLNIKQLRFKLHGDEPQRATLNIKGEKKVTGSDFKLPDQLELINKDLHIATLTDKNAKFEMEIQVERGLGYQSVDAQRKDKMAAGVMLLDAAFSPVRTVKYQTENMRVGGRTDFDKIRLELETDGTITPAKAFFQAAEILVKQFEIVLAGVQENIEAPKEKQTKTAETKKKTTAKATKKEEKKS